MDSTPCNQIYFKQVADALLTMLPYDVRDCVYGHFWETELEIAKDRLLRRAMALPTAYLPQDYLLNAWLMNPVHQGQIVDEILTYLYNKCFAPYDEPNRLIAVHHFLSSDAYQRNLTPTLFIKTLNIRWIHFAMSSLEKKDIANVLKALRHIQFPAPISIHFVLGGYFRDVRMHKIIIRNPVNFKWTCRSLEQKGHTVRITENDLGMNFTGFYSMSKDAWVDRMNGESYREALIEGCEMSE